MGFSVADDEEDVLGPLLFWANRFLRADLRRLRDSSITAWAAALNRSFLGRSVDSLKEHLKKMYLI